MRLATWNIQKGLVSHWDAVEALDADVLTVQECEPATRTQAEARKGWTCEWEEGRYSRRGVAVLARSPYEIQTREGSEPGYISTMISGPGQFRFVGFWAMTPTSRDDTYAQQATRLIEQLPDDGVPAVIAGDFNASKHPLHLRNVAELANLGLVSAYHSFHKIDRTDTWDHPTSYHRWQERSQHHMDYVFVPKVWTIHSVEVGTFVDYSRPGGLSDHVPVVVSITKI